MIRWPLLPVNPVPFSPDQGTEPQKDVWSDPQGRGCPQATFLGHGVVYDLQEFAYLLRAGDGGKAPVRVRAFEGKPFPDGIGRVVLAFAHGNAEVENTNSDFSNLAQGVVFAFGLKLLEQRPNVSGLYFVNPHPAERANNVPNSSYPLTIVGMLLPCFAHGFQLIQGHSFLAHGIRLALGYTLFFLHGFFYLVLFLLPFCR